MTTSTQKQREEKHLIKTLVQLGVTDYSILDKDGESPDFLVDIAGQTTGIEVTDIYREFSEGNAAKTQSDLPEIVKLAVDQYSQQGGKPLNFGFCFNGREAVGNRKKIAKKIGDFLYQYIRDHFPDGLMSTQEIDFDKIGYPMPLISLIVMEPSNSTTATGFTLSGFDSMAAPEIIIEKAIRKKEALIGNYKERCEKIRLLIVIPSMMLAADFTLPDYELAITHSFDEVYLLDDYRDKINIIKNGKNI